MIAGAAWGQSQVLVQSTKAKVKAVPTSNAPAANSAPAIAQVKPVKPTVRQVSVKPAPAVKSAPGSKPASAAPVVKQSQAPVAVPVKIAAKPQAVSAKPVASKPQPVAQPVSVQSQPKPTEPKSEKSVAISLTGRRDPFISPVISQSAIGSGCSSGKRCLAVGAISLKGIVKAESGMIAVVVNALDKAYFLRENDPVFNGYVVKITGDSVVFKETVQDKLGKPFTREVTKRISTPAV